MIIQIDGIWWPQSDRVARGFILSELGPAIDWLLAHCPDRNCIVQAGGNVGTYPLRLAEHFKKVVTFEPDPDNWKAMTENFKGVPAAKRIEAHNAALGDVEGLCAVLEVEHGNCGAHRINPSDKGTIPVVTVDGLKLKACDVIFLDIEGFELPALAGAVETIKQFSPVIALEMKRLSDVYGYSDQDTHDFLLELGYDQVAALRNDRLYVRH